MCDKKVGRGGVSLINFSVPFCMGESIQKGLLETLKFIDLCP